MNTDATAVLESIYRARGWTRWERLQIHVDREHPYVSRVSSRLWATSSLQIDQLADRGQGTLTHFLDLYEPFLHARGVGLLVAKVYSRRLVHYLGRRGYQVVRDEGRGFGRQVDLVRLPASP